MSWYDWLWLTSGEYVISVTNEIVAKFIYNACMVVNLQCFLYIV